MGQPHTIQGAEDRAFGMITYLQWKLLQLGGGGYMVPPPWPFRRPR
jgi:hypothetical protein